MCAASIRPGDEYKVITSNFGLRTVLELAVSCLSFVIDFSEFLSRTKKLGFPRQGEEKEGRQTGVDTLWG
jgi:hypothetical protein